MRKKYSSQICSLIFLFAKYYFTKNQLRNIIQCLENLLLYIKLMESDFKTNRQQFTIEMRREHRQKIFKRRRFTDKTNNQIENQNQQKYACKTKLIVDPKFHPLIEKIMEVKFNLNEIETLCKGLASTLIQQKHRAAIGLRVIISEFQSVQLMQRAIDAGCVPHLISYMLQQQYPQIQLEATWILTNIACGRTDQCQSIVDKSGLQAFIEVIKQNKPFIVEQALWGLGNIAGDSPRFRDLILQKGALDIIIKAIDNSNNVQKIEQGAWALSNLCRNTPRPKYELVKIAIPILCRILMSDVVKQEIMVGCLWAIAANSQTQKTRIQKIIDVKGFVQYLVTSCKKYQKDSVLIPLLKIIGNISNGNEVQTDQLLKADCLSLFLLLLDHQKSSIRREVGWILSNICVGTASQINQILTFKPLLQKIALLFQIDDITVKLEICYVVANICYSGTKESAFNLINSYNFFDNLVNILMQETDGKCLSSALNLTFELLNLGKKMDQRQNVIYRKLQSVPNLFERLAALQTHQNEDVYKKLVKIFHTHFKIETDSV